VLDPEVVEVPKGLTGEEAQLRMVTFRLELGNYHNRHDDMMFVESRESGRVGEQDAGVEDVGTTVHRFGHAYSPGSPA